MRLVSLEQDPLLRPSPSRQHDIPGISPYTAEREYNILKSILLPD